VAAELEPADDGAVEAEVVLAGVLAAGVALFLLLEQAASSVTAATVGAMTTIRRRRRLPVGKLKLMVSPLATGAGREARTAANGDIVALQASEIKA